MSISGAIRNLVLMATSILLGVACANAQTPTRAFYYNANAKLLQIEDLTNVDMSPRLTQDISDFRIPRMVTKNNNELSPSCPAAGTTQNMSNRASFAIYWGVHDVNDTTEALRPLNLEYLTGVKSLDREIKCVPINEDAGCPQGTRCLTGCVSCTSYCCVR